MRALRVQLYRQLAMGIEVACCVCCCTHVFSLVSSTVGPRADDLEYRRPFEISRDDISVVCGADGSDCRVDRQDGITHQRKCVRKQTGANEPGSAFGDPVRRGRSTRLRRHPEEASSEYPGVLQVILAADLAYDPFGKAAS